MARKALDVWKLKVTDMTRERFVQLSDVYYLPIGEVVRRMLIMYDMVGRNTGEGAQLIVRDSGLWLPPLDYTDEK